MADASAIRFGELQQDINRLESNSETQRKYIGQELHRVELQTQSAVDQAQQQIDSLRQQTADMHTSLGAMNHHSETLTEGLKKMMTSFSNLRFDLPNTFDNWMRVRTEQQLAGGETVSSSDLCQGGWSSSAGQMPIPYAPTVLPLHRAPSSSSAPDASCSQPSLHPPSRSSTDSPTDLYHQFMVNQESEAMMDLQKDLDQDGKSGDKGMDMDVDGEQRVGSELWEGTGDAAEQEEQEQLAGEEEPVQREYSQREQEQAEEQQVAQQAEGQVEQEPRAQPVSAEQALAEQGSAEQVSARP